MSISRALVLLPLLALSLTVSSPPARAVGGLVPGQADVDRAERLDRLFARLKLAPNAESARAVANDIWQVWTRPEDPHLAHLMGQAFQRREARDFAGAIAVLDRVVVGWPEYSEGWNQRATLHFLREDYEKSLHDIAKTLELEPRHFGALAGRAVIRLRQGKRALGLQNVMRALEIHPFLPERGLFPELETLPVK